MGQNIRIGRIAGIPIGLNWSVLFIFSLFAWELADLILPADHPHDSVAVYWAVGIVTTILLFVSLLGHEVAHAVVAKRNGIGVRRITLWLFGGVSELESDALTPGADFRIAVVGPLTSFALAGLFGLLVLLLHQVGDGAGVVASALGWLAWINLFLGGFNLIPAAPLDGGRVLRAALWKRSGDRIRAATSAARVGQAFGYVLVGLGVLEFFTVSVLGLWFVLLGWFLLSAARGEERAAVMRDSLADVHVRDIMTPHPTTFDPSMTVADLFENHFFGYHFSSYPLVGVNGRVEGLTSMRRLRHVPPHLRPTTRLIETASPVSEVAVGSPGQPVAELLQRMEASPDGRAMVLDDSGRLVGIVSPSDVARYVQVSMLHSQGRTSPRS